MNLSLRTNLLGAALLAALATAPDARAVARTLVGIALGLTALGLVMIYSWTAVRWVGKQDPTRALARQLLWVVVAGVAWAQTRGIATVEVQVDDGEWREARLAEALNDDTWRQWAIETDLDAGPHSVRVRATDGDGELQTDERVDPLPDGATGWHTIRLLVQD